MNDETEHNNWISSNFFSGSSAHETKRNTARHFANSDENPW